MSTLAASTRGTMPRAHQPRTELAFADETQRSTTNG